MIFRWRALLIAGGVDRKEVRKLSWERIKYNLWFTSCSEYTVNFKNKTMKLRRKQR